MWNAIRSWAVAIRSRLSFSSASRTSSRSLRRLERDHHQRRARLALTGATVLDRMERREVLSATPLTAAPDLSADLDALAVPIVESLPTNVYSWAPQAAGSAPEFVFRIAAPADQAIDLALERSILDIERERAGAWDWLDRPEVRDSSSIVIAEVAALGIGGAAAVRLMDDAIEDMARLTGSFRRVAVRLA